jgi:rSAM/selenodomain-associated transferase 1
MQKLIDSRTRWEADDQLSAFVLMAKAPRVGRVKTRLIPPLSAEEAAELSRCFIRDMAANVAEVARIHRGVGVIAFTPPDDAAAFDDLLPPGFHLLPQRGADLGERLLRAAEDLLSAGFASVSLINADSPTLPQARLAEAAALLRQNGDRVVLGEADDGGYYLIGLKRAHEHMFHRIDWSTSRVFKQSTERAAEIGLEIAQLAPWYDVDDAATISRLYGELVLSHSPRGNSGSSGFAAPETATFLRELAARNATMRTLLAESSGDAAQH